MAQTISEQLDQVLNDFERNVPLLIRSIGDVAILVVLVDKKVRLGMLFYECKQCIKQLTEIL